MDNEGLMIFIFQAIIALFAFFVVAPCVLNEMCIRDRLRSVRGLTKRCCNFLDGDCLLLDGACPQFISRSLICR